MKITSFSAREIKDSRGRPTIELALASDDVAATASVPSGKSTGSKEAIEKRDDDGGVSGAIDSANKEVAVALAGKDFSSPDEVDKLLLELDGTPNKKVLGANVILAVSIATTKLFAETEEKPIWKYISEFKGFAPSAPRLFMNVLNGGAHANFSLPFQEYIIIPKNNSIFDAYAKAGDMFEGIGKNVGDAPLGDEGGYAPKFDDVRKPFEILRKVVGDEADIAIDAAASEFYKNGRYKVGSGYDTNGLLGLYKELVSEFDILSIEDPFAEDDVLGFALLTEALGDKILVVGDDLTVTNPRILMEMTSKKAGNALIIKPNQIGTLSEVYETVRIARDAGWKCVASHRSGETDDSFIADLAVAIGAYGIKAGASTQRERRVKYDRLVEIEKEFAG